MTYEEDTPAGESLAMSMADDPWQEIIDELNRYDRRNMAAIQEVVQEVTLPGARRLGELLDNLRQQYDDNRAFLQEAEVRTGRKKSQLYAYLRVYRQWDEIQAAIAAGHNITSLKGVARLFAGAMQTPALTPAAAAAAGTAAGTDAVDVDHVEVDAQQHPQAPAAGDGDGIQGNGPTAWSRSEAAALDVLRGVPGACDQLIAVVPPDRGDLVRGLEALLAAANKLHNQLRSALVVAAEARVHGAEVHQLVVDVTAVDAEHLLAAELPGEVGAAMLGMDGGHQRGGPLQGDAEPARQEAAPVPPAEKRKKNNKGKITKPYPITPEGIAAFNAALASHGSKRALAVALELEGVRAIDQHIARIRKFEAEH